MGPWERVRDFAHECVGLAWDGCHKIYLLMDHGQVHQFAEYGYGDGTDDSRLLVEGRDFETTVAVLRALREWWDESCGLRFIQCCETPPPGGDPNDYIHDLIAQFEGVDDAPDTLTL